MKRYPCYVRVRTIWTESAKRRWIGVHGDVEPLPRTQLVEVYSAADEAAVRKMSKRVKCGLPSQPD